MINSADIVKLHESMRQWRHHLHQYPEIAFEEFATSNFIADRLHEFGLEVDQGLAKTGVVGTLKAGSGSKKIALRADMDALLIQEQNTFAHKSRHSGIMHACGHDGHVAMLLGAAKYLSEHKNFDGTVYFIFQPAEEGYAGARQMLEEGLFEKFPADAVFGMHNFHDIPAGHFAIKPGAMMASSDAFEISLKGRGTHAAIPHLGDDLILIASHFINALQGIVSRTVNPAEAAVISITQIHSGGTWNALPDTLVMRGTFRCFDKALREAIICRISKLLEGVCASWGIKSEFTVNPNNCGYPVTFNTPTETELAIAAATKVAGSGRVNLSPQPSMGAEDFAFMLEKKPGSYIWIGNGPSENGCLLHNPNYDFNDEILVTGANYWIELVKLILMEVV